MGRLMILFDLMDKLMYMLFFLHDIPFVTVTLLIYKPFFSRNHLEYYISWTKRVATVYHQRLSFRRFFLSLYEDTCQILFCTG